MNTKFAATFVVLEGKRTLILDYKGPDGRSLFVTATEIVAVRDDGLMAVAYEFHEPTDTRRFGIIQIVAGPGISIGIENWPDDWQPSLAYPALRVFRTQNPLVVPPLGGIIRPSFLLLRYEEGTLGKGYSPLPYYMPLIPPLRYAQLSPFPGGLEIYHPASHSLVTIRVPETTRDPERPLDGQQRFSYRFHEDVELATPESPIFSLLLTKGIELEIRDTRTNRKPTNDALYGLKSIYQIWIGDFERINDAVEPSQRNGFVRVNELMPYSKEGEQFITTMADLLIGMIPVVGDLADIGEFLYALETGKDKWGHDVNTLQLTLMGVLAFTPLLGSGLARLASSKNLFGRFSNDASLVARQVQDAGLTMEEWRAIARAEELLVNGSRIDPHLQQVLATGLNKLQGEKFRSLDEILDANGESFNHALIQRYYEAAQQRRIRKGHRPDPPESWIRKTRGRPQALLRSTLGPNYSRVRRFQQGGHRIRTSNIPRPSGRRRRIVERQLEFLLLRRRQILERLANAVKEGQHGRPSGAREIKSGHFRILKGNIAELLSRKLQLKYLAEVLAKYPDALLVEGVYARTIDATGALSRQKLFSDNLIVRFVPDQQTATRLEVLGVIEVKSGYSGGLEAQLQVFEWIEGRIDDGAHIVLSNGTRLTGKAGKVSQLSQKKTFVYNPKKPGIPRVIYLQSAQRHLITAKDRSLLGIESSHGIAPNVSRDELDLTSTELDYLTGLLAEQFSLGLSS